MTRRRTAPVASCWCGEQPVDPFSDDYLRCDACGTLVLARAPRRAALGVRDDARDFYGRSYYQTYLTDRFQYPPLSERARQDIGERCLHWLRALLKYRLPPAAVLELGSAHGGFVALMRQAGYEATGLELSPSVVRMARRTFRVPVLLGRLEQQRLKARTLDAVVLMDVLEHLTDPEGTLQRCLRLLRPKGLILIQTPRYPEGSTLASLRADGHRFLEQLKPDEHLFLFSERAIRRLFERLGVRHVVFEPAIFAHYDMFLAAGRRPLKPVSPKRISDRLSARPAGRFVLALMDVDDERRRALAHSAEYEAKVVALVRQLEQAEADRAARLGVVEEQGQRLGRVEAERNRAAAELRDLRRQVEAVETDRAARLGVIEEQRQRLQAVEAACDAVAAELGALKIRLAATEHDRATLVRAKELDARQIASAGIELGRLSKELDRVTGVLERTEQVAAELRRTVRALEQTGRTLEGTVRELERDRTALRGQLAGLSAWKDAVLALWASMRDSRAYRWYRSAGGWMAIDAAASALLRLLPAETTGPVAAEEEGTAPDTGAAIVAEPEAAAPPVAAVARAGPTYAEAERLAERLAAYLWRPEFFGVWERHGLHVTPVHFYSPVPDVSTLASSLWPAPSMLRGVDMREPQQLALLESCRAFNVEYNAFPDEATDTPHQYFRNQLQFCAVDAEMLHCLVRRSRPRRIVEVGSGFSTLIIAAAALGNAAEGHPAEFVAIDPKPNEMVRQGVPGLTGLRIEHVQSQPPAFADDLGENDILFIDSSHVVRIDSDVRFLFLEVLPRLNPGVLVHIHDIFLPAEYPRWWVVDEQRFWTEQYLLHALLLFSSAFEVVWAASYMHLTHPEALERAFPAYHRTSMWPGSFWIRRTGRGEHPGS